MMGFTPFQMETVPLTLFGRQIKAMHTRFEARVRQFADRACVEDQPQRFYQFEALRLVFDTGAVRKSLKQFLGFVQKGLAQRTLFAVTELGKLLELQLLRRG